MNYEYKEKLLEIHDNLDYIEEYSYNDFIKGRCVSIKARFKQIEDLDIISIDGLDALTSVILRDLNKMKRVITEEYRITPCSNRKGCFGYPYY
jgi:hypothetical protein